MLLRRTTTMPISIVGDHAGWCSCRLSCEHYPQGDFLRLRNVGVSICDADRIAFLSNVDQFSTC
jgi:hypothetical protein